MLSPSSNPLLNDLEEERHAFLLERRNLVKKPPAIPWQHTQQWTSQGYHAQVTAMHCTSCGETTKIAVGIFHTETCPSGASRSVALSPRAQWPMHQEWPIQVDHTNIPYCAHCLTDLGFKD